MRRVAAASFRPGVVLAALVIVAEFDWESVADPLRAPASVAVWTVAVLYALPDLRFWQAVGRVPLALLTAWSAWALLAANWSPRGGYGYLVGVGLVTTVVYAAWFAGTFGWRELARVTALALGAFMAAGVVREVLGTGGVGEIDRFVGFAQNPTDAGRIGVLAVLLAVPGLRWSPDLRVAVVALGAGTAFASGGRTALLGGLLALLLVVVVSSSGMRRRVVAAVMVAAVGFTIVNLAGANLGSQLVARDENGTDIETVNGRDEVWAVAFVSIAQRPVLGAGTAASDEIYWDAKVDGRIVWDPHNAHQAFLQTTLEYGVVGLLLLSGTVIGYVATSRRLRDPWRDAAVLMLGVNAFTESMLHESSLALVVFAAACGAVAYAAPTVSPDLDRRVRTSPDLLVSGSGLR